MQLLVDSRCKHAKQSGESDERLFAVAAWREAPYFDDADRAKRFRCSTRPQGVPSVVTTTVFAVQVERKDVPDLLRSLGGLLLAVGAVVLYIRKASHNEWSELARLLVVLIPAAALYLLALEPLMRPPRVAARPWQAVLMVTSILLWPLALFSLLGWIGADFNRHVIYVAVVFAITALLAAYAARYARIRYAALLSGLSLLIVWLYVWQAILSKPDAGTARWLLLAAAVVLLAGSAALAHAKRIGASEVATIGGIAAVSAGVLGVMVGTVTGATRMLAGSGSISSRGVATSPPHGGGNAIALHHAAGVSATHLSGLQHLGWDVYLLVVSLTLIWIAARWSVRGLGYVGAVGLLGFIVSVAAEVTRVEAGRAPNGALLGWPLILLLLGAAGLVAPMLRRRTSAST